MKKFIDISRATAFFSSVIPESSSRESVFAVVVPLRNDRSWTTTFQDDDNNNAKAKQHNR